jgi:hypothetical protein
LSRFDEIFEQQCDVDKMEGFAAFVRALTYKRAALPKSARRRRA